MEKFVRHRQKCCLKHSKKPQPFLSDNTTLNHMWQVSAGDIYQWQVFHVSQVLLIFSIINEEN